MSDSARPIHLTAGDFIAWAMDRPDGERSERAAGERAGVAPGRVVYARARLRGGKQREAAVQKAGLPCEVFITGMAVQVDENTDYEPDALVSCGPPLADNMRIPAGRDDLVVRTRDHTTIDHARGRHGAILTRILRNTSIDLAAGRTLENPFPVV